VIGKPGTDTGPELSDDPAECWEARQDDYAATCGQAAGDHCASCELCPGHHADDCRETPVERLDQLELIVCEAQPPHWELWTRHDPGAWYPPGCPLCWHAQARAEHAGCEHSHHRAWRRWKLTHRVVGWLYVLGITSTGGGWAYSSECAGCMYSLPHLRGRRVYVLGWPAWKWGCLIKNRHWPSSEYIGFGCCTKCAPCPECGSIEPNHDVFHQAEETHDA
jgi:hypothetical protein